MGSNELKITTKEFALYIISLVNSLDKSNPVSWVIGKQILRSGTSIGSNYRAASRAKSDSDDAYKIKIVEEECDEVEYWLELLIESNIIEHEAHIELLQEAGELTVIFSSISVKLKAKKQFSLPYSIIHQTECHLVPPTSYFAIPNPSSHLELRTSQFQPFLVLRTSLFKTNFYEA